jgi:hypothetical protein
MQSKTLELIDAARAELEKYHPMTLRQVFYRLVSGLVLENTEASYKRLSRVLVLARQEGAIPWEWIEDRLREPRRVSMWAGLADFAETAARAYRRDVWATQPAYLEAWLEKDALSGVFGQVLEGYGVTLNVGRGYDSWTSICEAAGRLDDDTTILYFGDFDPSGEDMVRSLAERLGFFGCWPEIVKVALTLEDIARYRLPPMPAKQSDSRAAAHIAKHGNVAVELDALPPPVLRERLEAAVRERLDLEALEAVKELEDKERESLRRALSTERG